MLINKPEGKTYTYDIQFYELNSAGEIVGDAHEYRALKRPSVKAAKDSFEGVLNVAIELEGWTTGTRLYVDATVIDNDSMTCVDDDSCHIELTNVEHTNVPSRHVDWTRAGNLPPIYAVDRGKTKWKLIEL